MPEALAALPTEARNPASDGMDRLPTEAMLAVLHAEDRVATEAVTAALPVIARAVDAVAARMERGGRLFHLGAGTSGRLGVLDASECPPTFSVPPELFVGLIAGGDSALRRSSEGAEDSREQGERDLRTHTPRPEDAVLGIAASGRTPWVLGGLTVARQAGALTLGLTCARQPDDATHTPVSGIGHAVEIAIELATGPEALTGSTRLKAGTATKMVLNLLSTGVMMRLGATFGNLMVNVQPTNVKLVDRAERIIAEATGCSRDRATTLLAQAREYPGLDAAVPPVKLAIAMELLGLAPEAAAARLRSVSGRLGDLVSR